MRHCNVNDYVFTDGRPLIMRDRQLWTILTLLKRFIEQTLKIQCGNYKEDYIKRRLLSRMRSTNTTTYTDYLRYLKANEPELENLRNALTINVTEFFRDNDVYEMLKKDVLPAIFKQRKRIRIWCAGCSTGEEPYSIAMILSEMIAQHPDLSAQIYATDIDKVVLAKAQEGIYNRKGDGQTDRSTDPPPFHQTSRTAITR